VENIGISTTIQLVCDKLDIPYTSPNPSHFQFYKDASRVYRIIEELKIIETELSEIEKRHKISGLSKAIEVCRNQLHNTEHDLVKLTRDILKEKKNGTIRLRSSSKRSNR